MHYFNPIMLPMFRPKIVVSEGVTESDIAEWLHVCVCVCVGGGGGGRGVYY